jgi:hypothetical protein
MIALRKSRFARRPQLESLEDRAVPSGVAAPLSAFSPTGAVLFQGHTYQATLTNYPSGQIVIQCPGTLLSTKLLDSAIGRPALMVFNGQLDMAWTDTQNHLNLAVLQINTATGAVIGELPGSKVPLGLSSVAAPALAVFANRLDIAWTGTDAQHHLNVATVRVYNGMPAGLMEGSLITVTDTAISAPALGVYNSQLFITWTSSDSFGVHENLANVPMNLLTGLPTSSALINKQMLLYDWFQTNMSDPSLRALARIEYAREGGYGSGGCMNFTDVLGLFNQVLQDGAVISAELHDLNAITLGGGIGVNVTSDAEELANRALYKYGLSGNMQDAVNKSFLGMDHPTASWVYSPVSGPLFGPGGPSYVDVQQGPYLGDCWLIASLAETAARRPEIIKSMFTYDGTFVESGMFAVQIYTVRFYVQAGTCMIPHYFTVDTMLPSGGYGMYDQISLPGGNTVLWVALAEKAYAEANGLGWVTSNKVGSDSYAALNNGWPSWALTAITGLRSTDYYTAANPITVAAAWYAGKLIVLNTSFPASPNIMAPHSYAVVNYTPFNPFNPLDSTNPAGPGVFTMMNPYGNNGGWVPGWTNIFWGLFSVPGVFLPQNFSSQSYASLTAGERMDGQAAPFALGGSALVTSAAGAVPSGLVGGDAGRLPFAGEAAVVADTFMHRAALANALFADPASQLGSTQARLEGHSPAGNEERQVSVLDDLFALVAERQPFAAGRLGA